jgi:hypothetical protein
MELQYNHADHPHAVSGVVTNSYICLVGAVCDFDQETGGAVDNSDRYDANGNMVSKPVNGQTYTLAYDADREACRSKGIWLQSAADRTLRPSPATATGSG